MPNWTGVDPAQWALNAIKKVEAAPRYIVEEMANSMAWTVTSGGFTPVDTGNLSRSVTISTTQVMRDDWGYHSPVRQDYGKAVEGITGDTTAFIGYKAAYAHRVNYGFVGTDSLGRYYNQSGRGFLEANVAKFDVIVAKAVKRLEFIK